MSMFELPVLPLDYNAFEPFIDAKTMMLHHKQQHQWYIDNLNDAATKFPELASMGLVDLNTAVGTGKLSKEVETRVRNNAGGHWNHCFCYMLMAPPGTSNGPSAEMKKVIDSTFGSMDQMKIQFNATAARLFGSGYTWLGMKPDGTMCITTTPNEDNPLMQVAPEQCIPIMGLDVWEHAYIMKYESHRPEYISAFWNIINWEQMEVNFKSASAGTIPELMPMAHM